MSQYKNPVSVCVALIPVNLTGPIGDERLAGIIRGKSSDDGYGKLALPSGFNNEGESFVETMIRELREEIQFETDAADWKLLYSDHIPGANLNLVYMLHTKIMRSNIFEASQVNEEVKGFKYIDRGDHLAFPLHERAVESYYAKYRREQQVLNRQAEIDAVIRAAVEA